MSAMYLSVGFILCLLKLRASSKIRSKVLYALLSALFLIGTFYTTRRGSIAVIFIIAALVYFKSSGSTFSKILLMLTALFFVALIGFENIPGLNGVLKKFETLIGRGSIMNGREKSFVRAFGVFLEKPILGHGIGQIDNAFGYAWLENSYLLALVEGGIVGAAALFAPYIVAIKETIASLKTKAVNNYYLIFAVYIQIMFALMSVIENYFALPLNTFLFYLTFFAAQSSLEESVNGGIK
jgi:O-antigen ligase